MGILQILENNKKFARKFIKKPTKQGKFYIKRQKKMQDNFRGFAKL